MLAVHKYPALHHSLCQPLSSKLDYIKLCCWKKCWELLKCCGSFSAWWWNLVVEAAVVFPLSEWAGSGLMLELLLCWGHMLLHSAANETGQLPQKQVHVEMWSDHLVFFFGGGTSRYIVGERADMTCIHVRLHVLWCLQRCCLYICSSTCTAVFYDTSCVYAKSFEVRSSFESVSSIKHKGKWCGSLNRRTLDWRGTFCQLIIAGVTSPWRSW